MELRLYLWEWIGVLTLEIGVGATLFGLMILTLDGVSVSQYLHGLFYRVQVGIQSPQGVTTTRGVLRRFNDFMKLFAALKKAYPQKNLPRVPPKGLLRMKSKALLEARRCSLEMWMEKLLSVVDISRSVVVASFLELEAAARSSFQDENTSSGESNSSERNAIVSLQPHSHSIQSVASLSHASDYGNDTAYMRHLSLAHQVWGEMIVLKLVWTTYLWMKI